jgi:phosphoglycerol geranylgeranyltransferase
MTVYEKLLSIKQSRGAGFFILLDPDRKPPEELADTARKAEENGADAILVGSSLLLSTKFGEVVRRVKKSVQVPVVIFPGNVHQMSPDADAILFLSLISGRNPYYLIGEQVEAAPVIKEHGLEPIPTGYMVFETNYITSVQFMSGSEPLPRAKKDIAMAHALAAQYLGMKLVFCEGGSGSPEPAPPETIKAISEYVDLPIIVGGGVRTPELARTVVEHGASFVVVGNPFEKDASPRIITEFAEAVHIKG